MRLLFLSAAAELGGAERCMLDCIAVLCEKHPNVRVSVLLFADGPIVREARSLGAAVRVLSLPVELAELGESGGPISLAGLWKQARALPAAASFVIALRKAVAEDAPDVVQTNGIKAHLLAGLAVPLQRKVVANLQDFIGGRRASRYLMPLLAARPRTIFAANSNAVATDFRKIAPGADVRTLYNVVDVNYFSPGAAEESWLADCAGLAPPEAGTISFGLVATYATWKGHRLFIQAAARLREASDRMGVPTRFYVVGGPIYATASSQVNARDLLAWAQDAGIGGRFGLVTFQSYITRVYRSLNVVVHASTKPEPFGRTIVEAMACARPVVVSQAGGASELFQHDENAIGFSPGDAGSMAAAMARFLDTETRARIGEAAREHVLRSFSRRDLAPRLLDLYQR